MQTDRNSQAWLPFLLLLTGSVVFVAGGSFHPHADASMGPVGSVQFFMRFAHEIAANPGWIPMHAMILAGPVCWALAAPGIRASMPKGAADALWGTAQTALTLAAALWIVGFVFDGFIAPIYAGIIAAASEATVDPTLLTVFRANQNTLVRLGLISWILLGIAAGIFSIGLLMGSRLASWRTFVGVTGVLVGAWPVVAAITGEFSPGPFTSTLWKPTALATALWHVALGTCLFARNPARMEVHAPGGELMPVAV